jgi:nucleoside-diphosphate-sugar epimerase
LAESGWSVRAGARRGVPPGWWPHELGVESVTVDRADGAALTAALGDGCDVLVDCVAYTAEHGRQLIGLADRIGSAIVMSSVAVYADATGRGFDNDDEGWPELPIGCTEQQSTTAPSDRGYAGRKVALEQTLLSAGTIPVTVLRPGAVYGRYSHYPREWYFVKRALDRRRHRILAYHGNTRFHTISATNLAELVRLSAQRPASRVLNAGDPDAPTAREIGAAISAVLGHDAEDVLIDGPPPMREVGDTPWSAVTPVVMDMSKAEAELGYRPPTTYQQAVEAAVSWMVDTVRGQDWRDVFAYFYANQGEEAFDYDAEDEWLAARGWR